MTVEETTPDHEIQDRLAADRRTIRRALRAGVIVMVGTVLVTLVLNVAFGGDGVTAGIWVTSSIVVGTLVTAGWLVLAMLLDLVAGEMPGRRRLIWTAGAFVVAFLSPILPAAMLQVAATR